MKITTFGIDLAKGVFQVHGVDADGRVVVQRALKRSQVLAFFARHPAALIGMEACGSAHYWARELIKLGHTVKLMPPAYVKPYVRRNKNDARDAEACCEAVGRPTMRFVAIKSVEQQCGRSIHRARDLLIRQKTQVINALRGLLYEVGLIAAGGQGGRKALVERVEAGDPAIPAALLPSLSALTRQWRALDEEVARLDERIAEAVKQSLPARRLMTIPGVGPISAHAVICAIGDASQFASARDFAAWVGLTRKNHDTGGKARLTGHISRMGDQGLRRLLVLGASAWVRQVRVRPDKGSAWVNGVLSRRPVKVAVVAQAAKTARIIWAILRSGQDYRAPAA
jgi:transposase